MFGLFLLEVLGHFVLLAQLRFEKGARRVHRLDDAAVRGGAGDEVQQVAPPVRCLVLPRPLGGTGELHGQGVLLPVPDSGHAPLAVPLDAVWQIAPAEGFGVGLELGVERLAGLVEMLVAADGLLEVCGGLPDFAEPGGLGEPGRGPGCREAAVL